MANTRVCGDVANRSRSRIGVVGAAAALAIAFGVSAASAQENVGVDVGVNNANSIVDSHGNRIEVLQMGTNIHTVAPLDSSPLSVEFFHDGVAAVKIDGPGAAEFTGTKLTIGYQIGYPIALTGATVVLNTPGLDWAVESGNNIGIGLIPEPALGIDISNGFALGGDIIPSQELDIDLGPGGITDVPLLEDQEFDGPEAIVRMAGVHGYVRGVIGPVTIRPYAKAVTSKGDTVVTYGAPQRL